MSRAGTA